MPIKTMPTTTIDEMQVVGHEEPIKLRGRPRSGPLARKLANYDELPEALLERFAAFLSEEDYLSLEKEIALARALFLEMYDKMKRFNDLIDVEAVMESGQRPPQPPVKMTDLMSALEVIGRLLEKQHKIMYSGENTITVEAGLALVLSVAQIVNMFVKDADERSAIYEAFRSIIMKGKAFNITAQVTKRLISPDPIEGEYREVENAAR